MSSHRLVAIDATRGLAMIFVFIAHIGWAYELKGGDQDISQIFMRLGMIASPTFIIISGCLSGLVFSSNEKNIAAFRMKYFDRGLFLLTACHILLFIAHIAISGSIEKTFRWLFITDVIGIGMITSAILSNKIKIRSRLIIGIAMYAISWLAIIFWTPEAIHSRLIKDTLFGTLYGSLYEDNFPLIPWIGFYLAASCIGQKLGEFYNNNELRKSLNLIAGTAVIMLVSMLIIKLSAKGLALIEIFSKGSNVYEMTAHLYLKLPPGMCYFLFYGGIGLSLFCIIMKMQHENIANKTINYFAMLGRTSLMLFVVQYYLYFTVYYKVDYLQADKMTLFIYLFLSVGLMSALSSLWDANALNRYISIIQFIPSNVPSLYLNVKECPNNDK